jgi:hypothetical protein
MSLEDRDRRRAAKRFNERVKLLATFLNNSGIATLVGGYVLPRFSGGHLETGQALAAFAFSAAAHMMAQLALTLLRSED